VFRKLANMLSLELFDLLCNLVQESGQGVRFVVANLTDQGVEAVHKTMVVSKSLRDGQSCYESRYLRKVCHNNRDGTWGAEDSITRAL
jgi:hypothetical protein